MPDMPNELVDTVRDPSVSVGAATPLCCLRNGVEILASPLSATYGLRARRPTTVPWRTSAASATDPITPTMPAVPSVWFTLDLKHAVETPDFPAREFAFTRAPISIGSPSDVPVPWTPTSVHDPAVEGSTVPSALIRSASWAEPFGAVKLLPRPPWLIAAPITEARLPCGAVDALVLMLAAATPSARPNPSALESRVLQRPSMARAPKGPSMSVD